MSSTFNRDRQTHGLNTTEAVIFRQLSMEALAHRDAVEFKNGVKVRLQDLEEGQNVEVLALSSEKADVQEHVRSRGRLVWHTDSSYMHDGSFAILEELGNFYSDGGPEIQRGFGR